MAKTRATYNIDKYDAVKGLFPSYLIECYGIVTAACKKAGISRETFYRWRREDSVFSKTIDEIEPTTHGFVEDVLKQMITEKVPSAVFFYLKTKCKHLGYIERSEITGKDGQAIEVQHTVSDIDLEILERYKRNLLQEAEYKAIEHE
jgi:hypothetical protein